MNNFYDEWFQKVKQIRLLIFKIVQSCQNCNTSLTNQSTINCNYIVSYIWNMVFNITLTLFMNTVSLRIIWFIFNVNQTIAKISKMYKLC